MGSDPEENSPVLASSFSYQLHALPPTREMMSSSAMESQKTSTRSSKRSTTSSRSSSRLPSFLLSMATSCVSSRHTKISSETQRRRRKTTRKRIENGLNEVNAE